MASTGTCPRGHELAENAVYCHVCWIRVEPVDPEVIASRRRRQRRIWIPLLGAGAVAFGVVVGGSLGLGTGVEPAAIVAGEAAPSAPSAAFEAPTSPATASSPVDAEEPATVAAPLAATVVSTAVRTLETCVPDGAATIVLKARSGPDEEWQDVPAEVTIGEEGACPEGELTATVTADSGADRWRLVVRDGDGLRIGRTTVDAPAD